ncbi:unnamed protein product, partial [Amoebophrya sp. A120]|eukprot:GSA120T00025345001.1
MKKDSSDARKKRARYSSSSTNYFLLVYKNGRRLCPGCACTHYAIMFCHAIGRIQKALSARLMCPMA